MSKLVPTVPETAVTKPHERTSEESAILARHRKRRKQRVQAPPLKVEQTKNGFSVSPDHPELGLGYVMVMEALGTADVDFQEGLVRELVNASSPGSVPDERGLNFALSMVKGIAPRDETEAMMAAQMAAVHMATMTFARRLAHTENIQQQDNAFNKLARTFAAQVEALKRHRTGGEQKVTVQHVTVNDGGQAVVGSVSTAPGGGGGFGKPGPTP